MGDLVKIVECPRDAWQGLPSQIPAEAKADYLRKLVTAGFRHIDAVSFVSHAAVPQMADSERVLAYLNPPEEVEIVGIVVNVKGAERAIATGAVQTLGFPYSISPQFLARNQRQTPEESLDMLEAIGALAYKAGLDLVAYVSMAFGNPYGDAWRALAICWLVSACNRFRWPIQSVLRHPGKSQIHWLMSFRCMRELRLACICMRGSTMRRRGFARRTRRGAGDSMRPSAD